MLVLRRRDPGAERKFRAPAAFVIGPLGILGCLYLFWSLPAQTRWYFLLWNIIGFAVYALWAQRQAAKARAQA
jgi:APA family basic amino acid/polyamine antiporter